eukprot:403366253
MKNRSNLSHNWFQLTLLTYISFSVCIKGQNQGQQAATPTTTQVSSESSLDDWPLWSCCCQNSLQSYKASDLPYNQTNVKEVFDQNVDSRNNQDSNQEQQQQQTPQASASSFSYSGSIANNQGVFVSQSSQSSSPSPLTWDSINSTQRLCWPWNLVKNSTTKAEFILDMSQTRLDEIPQIIKQKLGNQSIELPQQGPSIKDYLSNTKNITRCCFQNWPWFPYSIPVSSINSPDQVNQTIRQNQRFLIDDQLYLKMREIIRQVLLQTLANINQNQASLDIIQQVLPCAFNWYPWVVAINRNVRSYADLESLITSLSIDDIDELVNGPQQQTNQQANANQLSVSNQRVFAQSMYPWGTYQNYRRYPWGPQYYNDRERFIMEQRHFIFTTDQVQMLLTDQQNANTEAISDLCWYSQQWPFIATQQNDQATENFDQLLEQINKFPLQDIQKTIIDLYNSNNNMGQDLQGVNLYDEISRKCGCLDCDL